MGGGGASGDDPTSQDLHNDVLVNFSADQRREFRHLVVRAILSTDMSGHFGTVTRLSKRAGQQPAFEVEDREDRVFLAEAMVHTADLGAQALPLELARKWGDRVLSEFVAQAQRERELGIPVTKFMEGLEDPLQAMALQINFTSKVVHSLWDVMARCLPGLEDRADQVLGNSEAYQRQAQQLRDARQRKKKDLEEEKEGGPMDRRSPGHLVP